MVPPEEVTNWIFKVWAIHESGATSELPHKRRWFNVQVCGTDEVLTDGEGVIEGDGPWQLKGAVTLKGVYEEQFASGDISYTCQWEVAVGGLVTIDLENNFSGSPAYSGFWSFGAVSFLRAKMTLLTQDNIFCEDESAPWTYAIGAPEFDSLDGVRFSSEYLFEEQSGGVALTSRTTGDGMVQSDGMMFSNYFRRESTQAFPDGSIGFMIELTSEPTLVVQPQP